MSKVQLIRAVMAVVLVGTAAQRASAVQVVFDYRYDTNDFFADPTARATLEAAGQFFSNILINDHLAAIPFVDPNTPGTGNYPVWRQKIIHPGTGQNYAISSAANAAQDGLTGGQGAANEFRDIQVGQDLFLVYAGGTSSLGSNVAGQGGTGVAYFGLSAFNSNVDQRGKANGTYAEWGGYVTFNTTTNWHADHTTAVSAGETDLYSVAVHELAHALGLHTTAAEFAAKMSGGVFTGANALAAWNADTGGSATAIPLAGGTPFDPHWQDEAVSSYIFGTSTLQEAAMDPTITTGTRKHFTNVDVQTLADIGWAITIPEPASLAMMVAGAVLVLGRRKGTSADF